MRRSREDGLTLVELTVVLALMGVLGAVVSAVVLTHLGGLRSVEDSTRATDDVRLVAERISKELRGARSVLPLATGQVPASTLRFWVDGNGDGARTGDEELTYEIAAAGDRYELHRSTAAVPTPTVVVRNLTAASRFEYDNADPLQARVVTVTAEADGVPGRDAGPVRVQTSVRLRNAS